MNTRFLWLAVAVCIMSAGLLSCGSSFSNSNSGLVIVPSTGSAVVQAFGFNVNTGSPSTIDTQPPITGNPAGVVIDPTGSFAYVLTTSGIAPFNITSDGKLSSAGSVIPVSGIPSAITMDSAGTFLFVANGVGGQVSSFSISNGTISATPVSTISPANPSTSPNLAALAVTPLTFPPLNTTTGGLNSVCAGLTNTSAEYLYVVDSQNNVVWDFTVDSSGNLGVPNGPPLVAAGSVPEGIAVDSCNRFVYVSNSQVPTINAYGICNASANNVCPNPINQDGHLVPIATTGLSGSGSQLGAVAIDPFAKFVYVVDSAANKVFAFQMGQSSGKLTSLNPASVNTDSVPVSIAIRSDGLWMFVTNFLTGSVSEYSLTPATGLPTPVATITTDNNPFGTAVK